MHPRHRNATSKAGMRRRLLQFGAILILLVCICGHVSEIFDHWDNTLQTGSDIEYGAVIVALIAGAVLGFAHVGATALRTASESFFLLSTFTAFLPSPTSTVILFGYSPPQPLRI